MTEKEALERMVAQIRTAHEKAERRKVTEDRPGEDLIVGEAGSPARPSERSP